MDGRDGAPRAVPEREGLRCVYVQRERRAAGHALPRRHASHLQPHQRIRKCSIFVVVVIYVNIYELYF